MRILFFPKYSIEGASSRYRIYNYLDYYKEEGYDYKIFPLFDKWYFDNLYQNKSKLRIIHRIIFAYFFRLLKIFFSKKEDIIYIGADLFPFLPSFGELLLKIKKTKYIVEYDDAIFHNYDSHKIGIVRYLLRNKVKKAIKWADFVITGSPYLSLYVKELNENYIEIPTSIEKDKYNSEYTEKKETPFIIGWIGSKTTSCNILDIIPALHILKRHINFRIHLVGFDSRLISHLEGIEYRIIDWCSKTEVDEIIKFSVGIMPLKDNPFNQGKCAFKLIQYMACGKPTISTPLIANIKVNRDNNNLFASTEDEWINKLLDVFENPSIYRKVGKKNKSIVDNYYNTKVNSKYYMRIIKSLDSKY